MARVRLQYDRRRDGFVRVHRWRGAPIRMHRHAELELNLVLRGRGTYILEDRRYDLARDSLAWFFSGQNHILAAATADFEMLVAVFSARLVSQHCREGGARALLARNPRQSFCRRIASPRVARLRDLFGELTLIEADAPRYRAGLAYAMLCAWDAYSSASDILASGVLHPSVDRAARLIQDGADPHGLPALAREAGLSASRLSRLFAQQMGVSLAEFRNRCRLERFMSRYQAGGCANVLSVAFEAGFGSYAQFYRVFRRAMGYGPAGLRSR